jgi:cellulose synthase/poly-beta-1,6-N-acetylglucosamine synthase-like glycosyltransferase
LATLLAYVLGCAALLLLLPVTVLFAEVLLAVTHRDSAAPPVGERPRIAVLIPAHNEASMIAGTLRSIVPQLAESDRLIVVADNCTDETAAIAAAEGAETIERRDPVHRGKGYALDFGIRHLEADAPDVVVVIDADCSATTGSIDRLAFVCTATARPVQALYLMFAPSGAGVMTRIGEFAWTVKNKVRPLGLHRLGLPCQLMGTGMAFPWSRIAAATLATGHIVEDLKLGIDLARAGTPPLFCPEALVTSQFPASTEGIRSQRARWEHGYLSVILSDAPRLLWAAFGTRSLDLLAMAVDLSVPPLALLMLQVATVWLLSALLCIFAKALIPVGIATVAAVLFALSVLLSWAVYGRRIISMGGLAIAVLYALWKIPLYAKFLVSRQINWVRSKRDGE